MIIIHYLLFIRGASHVDPNEDIFANPAESIRNTQRIRLRLPIPGTMDVGKVVSILVLQPKMFGEDERLRFAFTLLVHEHGRVDSSSVERDSIRLLPKCLSFNMATA